ncbi:hypothetical protein [Flavobacterium sp.]|uniref:hypothetical protein n=1 Tax=Flavobacterium sp. TaxID=239 RepID=UPI003BD23002
MKNFKININFYNYKLIFCMFLLSLSLLSCSKKIPFSNSNSVPAARGNVTVKKDKNNNYLINLNLKYLAEPNRLSPPRNTYVVWMTTDESNFPINLGQILGTSKLKIKFETVSSFKPIRIFITAEDNASVQSPMNMVVLETNNF